MLLRFPHYTYAYYGSYCKLETHKPDESVAIDGPCKPYFLRLHQARCPAIFDEKMAVSVEEEQNQK